jgi:hypothetical protein
MRQYSLVIFALLLGSLASNAQKRSVPASPTESKIVEIDPRQYITVLYNRFRTREKYDTIWNWERRKNVPNQKTYLLDNDGQIKLLFDKDELIKNTDFFGNVTLEAEISGSKGTRQIEVNPYSEIGVARKAIGIKSDAPLELSNKLLGMLTELAGIDSIRNNLSKSTYTFERRLSINKFDQQLRAIDEDKTLGPDQMKAKIAQAFGDLESSDDWFYPELDSAMDKLNHARTDVVPSAFHNVVNIFRSGFLSSYKRIFVQQFTEAADYLQQELPLILQFLESFDNGGQEGLKAFLSLTSIDILKYNDLKNALLKDKDTLSTLHLEQLDKNSLSSDSVLLLYKTPILKTVNSLYNLSRVRGSQIARIIADYAKRRGGYNNPLQLDSVSNNYRIYNEQNVLISLISENKDSLAALLAKRAGEQIYKKLIAASIDLGKNGAAEGETLNLYLTWILDGSDSASNSPRLEIGKYALAGTGWATDVSDIFALVNRIKPGSTIDPTHESPSTFKGAGGAVFMWTYRKEDKGLNIHSDKAADGSESFYTRRKNVLMNFFQPSIGINVSYLDFNTTKDVEVGAGLQIGLFRNKVYFGYGVNLSLLTPKDAPFYFFLGFSFAKISDLFKDSNKISSNQ